jgi:superfamily I DNA/RNA helicase
VVGIKLDDEGLIVSRSSLLFDEEEEVLDELDDLTEYNIKYKVIKGRGRKIISRCISDKRKYLLDFFNSNNKIDIYKYIYYDFYEEEEDDIKKIKNKLIEIISGEWNYDCDRLYDSIKMISGVKQ